MEADSKLRDKIEEVFEKELRNLFEMPDRLERRSINVKAVTYIIWQGVALNSTMPY